ncbi:fibrobacter succinogenes major paralogous domain-containing protein [Flavihumibacter profundi]|uniref:fibrobacter succinogenes major paralogous domain-containing protein n=1 Tax=Flavihumibacter profundi TaxID=2716883 RepID=UPI001CC42344|nr:fibrobacter succinogenes major paralogous domain-containing protein [Flavihumibacter profundi]MBZ5855486.1 fibrobacter succinogenes major paralogous domain-containing protein [Flavihumibacter profundi]
MNKIIALLAVIISIVACNKSSTPAPVPVPPLTDIDGNDYDTVKIGTQFWMKQNLKSAHYRNGDLIPNVTNPNAWSRLTTGAWCWYNNDSAHYAAVYGRLYNWYAVNDPRGLAPTGWHVPTNAEWTTLSTGLGGDAVAGGAMKETGTTYWLAPNTGATNSSHFTARPGGIFGWNGVFGEAGTNGYWWSSTEIDATSAWICDLHYNLGDVNRDPLNKQMGISVRCLRD